MMTQAMQKTAKYTIAIILLIQMLATILSQTQIATAQQYYKDVKYSKGVKIGDYFTYGKFNIRINRPDAPTLPEWEKFRDIKTINFTIIENPIPNPWDVTFIQKITFTNKTEKLTNGTLELLTGLGLGVLFFIPAGLSPGQRIYPESASNPNTANYTWTVNSTRTHPRWVGREICVYNHTTVWWREGIMFLRKTILYWDRTIGVLLSAYDFTGAYGGPRTPELWGDVSYELVATNTKIPIPQSGSGEWTLIYIGIVIILVITFIAVIVKLSTSAPKKKWKRLKK